VLTDLSFLNIGQSWPPKSEIERLELIRHNKAIFEGEHASEYHEAFKRIERVVGNFENVVSYAAVINYQRLLSLKQADLLVGEEPQIKAGKHDSKEQLSADTIKKNTKLHPKSHETAIDTSRYGDGVMIVYKDGDKGMIDVTQPGAWFPVVDPMNIKKTLYHVLWTTYNVGEAVYLNVRVHRAGFYDETVFLLESNIIKEVVSHKQSIPTGLDDFAVIPFHNAMTSDRVHGLDDYSPLDSIVSELLVRVGQISRILDKHAAPSVSGPTSALERDPVTGDFKLKMGNFFPRDGKDDAPTEYIVWDAQLDANFKQIELLINSLHAISEAGSHLLGDKSESGGVLSGTALKLKLVSPLAKAKRMAMRFKPALEKAIVLCSQLGGKDIIPLQDVSITFMDGLPSDPKEEAEIMATRTGNKPTMSVKRAVQTFDQMNEEDAENELKQIQEEEEAANPMLGIKTPFNGENKPPNGDE
jgi:hypothetical protein